MTRFCRQFIRLCFALYLGVFMCFAPLPSKAQSLQDFVADYNKPTKMQHMGVDNATPETAMKHYKVEEELDNKAEQEEGGIAQSDDKKARYLPKGQSPIATPDTTPLEPEGEKGFSYKSTGIILAEDEHFPALSGLSEWPWLKELTYGLENAATQNAMQILDRDLSKAPPLAMIWAAQHYYDAGQQDKALFLYLASRLRSSVDQARFETIERQGSLSANDDNVELERTAGAHAARQSSGYEAYKDLSSYNAIAASIGRPILRYGLKNPKKYKTQLRGAMQWDGETPYEYLPSVNDLRVSEDSKDDWHNVYTKLRDVYNRQMLKVVGAKAK
jgi:hypothetical protein